MESVERRLAKYERQNKFIEKPNYLLIGSKDDFDFHIGQKMDEEKYDYLVCKMKNLKLK